jgi:D-alanyl-lipoteichoic acid acyltransferase DltB (MBOAT superfamily)
MLFNSVEYLIFFPIVFIFYWFSFNKNLRQQNIFLLISSYIFYGWWSWKFLALLILSTLLDYLYAFGVNFENKNKAKLFLWLSIINNLGILFIFKYFNFFSNELVEIFKIFGIKLSPYFLNFALPIGISFYTFHGMSYVFDIYNKVRKPVKNFSDYAVFVSFFPLLVAGPIERANHLLPQVQTKREFKYIQATQGLRLILWGLFKKIVIADSISLTVDEIFNNYNSFNSISLVIAAIGFSFQIYCDFSGYSDIAIGSAKLLGFELLSNFKFPYFSRNIAEFWRRWHISLSSWFKDYLYIPLGGSKNGLPIAIRNTFIIFIVSGFWHGAKWNFIIWGFIHACAFLPLLIFKINRKYVDSIVAENKKFPNIKEIISILTTFTIAAFAWIYFRSENLKDANNIVIKITKNITSDIYHHSSIKGYSIFLYIIPFLLLDWKFRHDDRIILKNSRLRYLYYMIFCVFIFLYFGKEQNFIYFQF